MDAQVSPKSKQELSHEHLSADSSGQVEKQVSAVANNFRPVLELRRTLLESLQPVLSVKFYDKISSKLKEEESRAMELSGLSRDKQKKRDQYSHVLDSQYFEQRFLWNKY